MVELLLRFLDEFDIETAGGQSANPLDGAYDPDRDGWYERDTLTFLPTGTVAGSHLRPIGCDHPTRARDLPFRDRMESANGANANDDGDKTGPWPVEP